MKFNELTKTRRSARGGEKQDLMLKKKTKMSIRFCETCRQEKPKNALPHVKGWQCTDCALMEKQKMTSSVTIDASELKRLYQKIHDLTNTIETLKAQTKSDFKTFMVIVPQTGKPYFTSDFTQACYLAVELTKSKEPVAVYGVERLGQTNVSSVVNFEKI